MNGLRRVSLVFFSILFSHSLYSMFNEHSFQNDMSDEILTEIFLNLDVNELPKVFIVCKRWNALSQKENLFNACAKKYFPNEMKYYKAINETWRVSVINFAKINDLSHKPKWSEKEVLFAISNVGFTLLEKHLLNELARKIISTYTAQITSGKELAVLLMSCTKFALSAVNEVACRACVNLRNNIDNAYCPDEWQASSQCSRANSVFIHWLDHNGWKFSHQRICTELVCSLGLNILAKVSPCLPPSIDDTERGKAAWNLSLLFLLDDLSKCNFEGNFKEIQDRVKMLAEVPHADSKKETFELWAEHTWGKPELAENPYIIFLQNIAQALAQETSSY